MRFIFVVAVLFVIGTTAIDSDYDEVLNSDESSLGFGDSDDSGEDFAENNFQEERLTKPPPTTKPPVISITAKKAEKLDSSWKKIGIEDLALRSVAFLKFDNPDYAKMWIRRGANVNGEDDRLETPLHKTAYKDNIRIAQVLIDNDADVNAVDASGRTPLRLAIDMGSLKVAELLIKNDGKENYVPRKKKPEKSKKQPTTTPAPAKNFTLEEMLLDVAFQPGDNIEEASALIEIGIDVNTQTDIICETPLHRAAYKDNIYIARALIDAGADVNAVDHGLRTPLQIAAIYGSPKIAKHLIENKANINHGDKMNNRPLHEAIKFANMDVAKLLIENGADINVGNSFMETPFHMVYLCDNPGFVKYMLQKGADIGVRDYMQRNARDYMKQYGNTKINFEIDRMLEEAELQHMQQHFG